MHRMKQDKMGQKENSAAQTAPIGETVDQMREAVTSSDSSVRRLLQELGDSSFGHVLLWPALIVVTPLSGIPGLSSLVGITIALISAQMLFGRDCLWLPDWILRRRLPRERFRDALDWLRRPVAVIDRTTRPRMKWMLSPPIYQLIQACCLLCGLAMPLLELVPMTSSILGAAVAMFAISLITDDGLLATIGLVFIGIAISLITGLFAGA